MLNDDKEILLELSAVFKSEAHYWPVPWAVLFRFSFPPHPCCNTNFYFVKGKKKRDDDLRITAKSAYKYKHVTTWNGSLCNQSLKLLIEAFTWQLPKELCGQKGHQSPPNDRSTSQLLFSFMCHIQLTGTSVCSLSHSLNPSLCHSEFCRAAPFQLPWLLPMAIFCPGSLDPSW